MEYMMDVVGASIVGWSMKRIVDRLLDQPNDNFSVPIYCMLFFLLMTGYCEYIAVQPLFYLGFLFWLTILFFTDLIESTVSDYVVCAGTIYSLSWQIYNGQLATALWGGATGLLLGIFIFISGQWLCLTSKHSNQETSIDRNGEESLEMDTTYHPFVPFLYAGVLGHLYSGFQLPSILLSWQTKLNQYPLINIVLLIGSCCLLLYLFYRRCKQNTDENPEQYSENEEEKTVAFGDGDVTTFILIGVTFGWQALFSIVAVAFVLDGVSGGMHLYIGRRFSNEYKRIAQRSRTM